MKRAMFFILDYGSCFFCLLATLLIIRSSYFSAFFAYASVRSAHFVECSSPLASSQR